MVAEGGAGGRKVGGILRFVSRVFGGWHVLLGDEVVDGFLHT